MRRWARQAAKLGPQSVESVSVKATEKPKCNTENHVPVWLV